MKIGVSISLKDVNESIWTNGLKLNIFYFIHMLTHSTKNYDVYLLNVNKIDVPETLPKHFDGVKLRYFDDAYSEMDLLVAMGSQMKWDLVEEFKKDKNKKVISYKCGNNYILGVEKFLFHEGFKTTEYENEDLYDEVWYVPQQHETCQGYFSTLHRTNALAVPFIWHYKFLKNSILDIEKGFKSGHYKKDYRYQIGKEKKNVAIMEPNINVVKFCLIPIFVCEESYRSEGKENIENVYIFGGDKLNKKQNFVQLIKKLDLGKDKMITAESRYQTPYILSQHADVIVSHQLLNPLNYLYLDAVYMGYPILHNAPLCKDLGYYYEGSNTKEGGKMLNYILKHHDENIEEYDKRNDQVLNRYFAENEELISMYDLLIDNLFNNTPNTYLEYNPETNLYKNSNANQN
jgi:hypothetical protein